MPSTFKYIMECYFYQDWQLEFSKSTEVLIFFAERESMEIVNNLIDDIKYIINNNLSEKIFEGDKFDFNPLLCGYIVNPR